MSGSSERVVFVHGRPGDESWLTGGTIARLHGDDSPSLVIFETDVADSHVVDAALADLGAREWRMLPAGGPDSDARAEALADAIAYQWATVVVVGDVSDDLRETVTGIAHSAGLPVFLTRRVSDAAQGRLVAIDVSDQLPQKLLALTRYPERWGVADHTMTPTEGSALTVTGTEAYSRLDAPRPGHTPGRPQTLLSRALAVAGGVVAGGAFGVLGTLAHQSTVHVGTMVVPLGLILALVAVTALLVGLRLVLGGRTVVLFCATGLLVTIFLLSLRGQGGSVLVPAGLTGTLWTVVPALVATFVLAWPRIPARK
ncbi:hypothetical protein [Cryobacterium psychrophilum]|uniref:Uncharacterized protein n=1 Tax=Cryobacterium psychrophilum TaxID=41988 RepID=A0A4Y8KIR0_9MICO|nr:hypothetical protein [Cryobacterium psychrophilum]TDW30897.1 hypothetical protein EDD25_2678 [Cryobacterium psychrophilum]TFD75717.1 hypothetical protein E3T53_14625 [Cryobacterium psychrophilum]